MRFERRYTEVEGYRFHSVHAGAGEPVILIHGLSGSHRWWRYTLPSLAGAFRVHVPELIGFGGSRPSRLQPSIPAMAELLVGWLDALGIERAHLIGHSMGGQISIHLSAGHPERVSRLVLVSAAGIPRLLTWSELTRFLAEIVPPRAWGKPSFLPTIAADALRAGPRVLWRATRHILADDVGPLLPRIVSQTLLVWGRLDPLTPLAHGRVMAASIPDSRLVVFPDAAHIPMADRPVEFNELVFDFLVRGHAHD